MHLLERYALACGSKIGKPFIVKKFFPVNADKYITIQNSSGMPGKCYDYFQDVVNFIFPKLEKNGYKIVQIGGAEDKPIHGCVLLNGKTNINQTAYIIDNSSLHIGNDSFAIHMASAFNVPTIGLYSISIPEISGPYWDNKKINLLPSENHRPSFNPNEVPKKVNLIKIEQVVSSINKILFNTDDINLETIYIGNRYNHNLLETMPDQSISPEFFNGLVLNIRFDYCDTIDEKIIISSLQNLSSRQCCIITDKSFQIEPFLQFKNNISAIIYDVTNGADAKFVENLNKFGIKNVCVFNKTGNTEENLLNRKFELMEICGVEEFHKIPENIPSLSDSMKFKTNKILLANGKIYNSRACQLEDISTSGLNEEISVSRIKNKDIILEDLDHSYIYQ